ncbi:CD276 antigen homolog [Rhinoraja longicauda]
MVLTVCGVETTRAPPKVHFLLSSTNIAVAATGCMHPGHPLETGSNIFERKATGCRFPPLFWTECIGNFLGRTGASDGGDQLLLSLGASDRTDYACTVWNPVSRQTANFTSERVCQQHSAVSALDVKTLEYPVNASLLQPAWLPVQVGALPQDAELTWTFQGKGGNSLFIIVRYEANVKRVKYFKDRVKLLDNFTLRIDSVRLEDVGTYTVSVTTPTELQAHVNLRAYEPVSGVRVEVANISSGHPCNLTLSCSAAAGDELNFGWSPGAGSPLGQASDGGDQLLLSLGASDRTDYACTVWNPVSHQTANFTSERVCQQHSVSMDRVNIIAAITISICVFLCLTFAIYKFCRRRKCLPSRGCASTGQYLQPLGDISRLTPT